MFQPPFQDKGPSSRWWSREDLLLLLLFGALFFLPGLGQFPLYDRDEPRFATAAREMLTTSDYIVPHFNTALRPDKPPLVYWLMTLSYRAVGSVNELAARLPSALCSTLTLLILYFMVGARFGRVTGLLAAIILGSCALFVVESRMATADATMILFIAISMACAWQAWDAGNPSPSLLPRTDYLVDRNTTKSLHPLDPSISRNRSRKMPLPLALLFWIALAAGTMTKGVPLFFVLIPMLILSITTGALPAQLRRWRSHFHFTINRIGIALTIAILLVAILSIPTLFAFRTPILILGILVVTMVLLPGLPAILLRCFTAGNWAWWKQLRPLIGFPLLIALVGWWVFLAGQQTHWHLIKDMVEVHLIARVGWLREIYPYPIIDPSRPGGNDAMSAYSKPPGTYLVLVWATFWPWSVLLVPAAFHTIRRVLRKTAIAIDPRPYQFLLAFILPMWILLELANGKLLHYPLPLYLPIAILCADAVVQSWHRLTDVLAAPWFAAARWVILIIWLSLAAAVLIGAKQLLDPELFWRSVPLAGALAAAGVAGAIAWNRPSWPFVTALGWAAALLFLNALLMPDLANFQPGKSAGLRMAELKKADPSLHLAAQGFTQPSLVFYAGEPLLMPTLDPSNPTLTLNPLDKIPFTPFGTISPQNHYLITLDETRYQNLKQTGATFYELASIHVPEIKNLDRTSQLLHLISNIPPLNNPAQTPVPTSRPASPK